MASFEFILTLGMSVFRVEVVRKLCRCAAAAAFCPIDPLNILKTTFFYPIFNRGYECMISG